jgi:cytidyltransferase-like protein
MKIENYDEHVLYVGRFQPPHLGHMNIFEQSLKEGKKICIAIRNVEPSEQNPLKAEIVKELWEKIYFGNGLVSVIVIPNISSIKYGRNVGYLVEEIKVGGEIANISATQIRDSIRNGDDLWKNNVSPLIHEDLPKLLQIS